MKVINCVQLSPEWWDARRGIPTASEFGRIITAKTAKLSAAADGYIAQLVAERIHLDPNAMTETPMNAAMRHGVACEPEARRWYEMERGIDVEQVGFCTTDDGRFGCSPDGLIGTEGALELKCPQMKTHIEWLLANEVPDEHRAQVHGHLIVTGRLWCDFMSYCVGAKPLLLRVVPDEFTTKLRTCLELFWEKYAETYKRVRDM